MQHTVMCSGNLFDDREPEPISWLIVKSCPARSFQEWLRESRDLDRS